jgi:uncharacterized protein YlxW (UPF0749 family)
MSGFCNECGLHYTECNCNDEVIQLRKEIVKLQKEVERLKNIVSEYEIQRNIKQGRYGNLW